jgi:hypothetical protein
MVAEYELRVDELTVLEHACRAADDADRLTVALRDAELTVPGSNGQPVPNGLLRELRETRAQVARLLAGLDVPEDGTQGRWDGLSASQRARKAVHVRVVPWRVDGRSGRPVDGSCCLPVARPGSPSSPAVVVRRRSTPGPRPRWPS